MRVAVGFQLQPEERYLELCAGLVREEAEYWEIAPETTWVPDESGALRPNGFHRRFQALRARAPKPFVAHGVAFSLGSARRDAQRDARWLARLAADQALFGFEWYTDHLGATRLDGCELTLPLPLPQSEEAAGLVRAALERMASVVPTVGFENSTFYYHLGDPLDEPAWIARALDLPRAHLLLDLHNVVVTAANAGFDPERYVARLPLEKVIEVHLSGGSESEPGWLPSRAVLRLDSHDAAVPEAVWELFERTLPHLPGLRGVTLERMEGTVEGEDDVALLGAELARIRRTLEIAHVR